MKFEHPVTGHWDSAEGAAKATEQLSTTREQLGFANMTDFHLANAVFLADRHSLDLIAYQTAAKERIRWLSAQLAARDQIIREWAAERRTFIAGETPQLREISERMVALVGETIR